MTLVRLLFLLSLFTCLQGRAGNQHNLSEDDIVNCEYLPGLVLSPIAEYHGAHDLLLKAYGDHRRRCNQKISEDAALKGLSEQGFASYQKYLALLERDFGNQAELVTSPFSFLLRWLENFSDQVNKTEKEKLTTSEARKKAWKATRLAFGFPDSMSLDNLKSKINRPADLVDSKDRAALDYYEKSFYEFNNRRRTRHRQERSFEESLKQMIAHIERLRILNIQKSLERYAQHINPHITFSGVKRTDPDDLDGKPKAKLKTFSFRLKVLIKAFHMRPPSKDPLPDYEVQDLVSSTFDDYVKNMDMFDARNTNYYSHYIETFRGKTIDYHNVDVLLPNGQTILIANLNLQEMLRGLRILAKNKFESETEYRYATEAYNRDRLLSIAIARLKKIKTRHAMKLIVQSFQDDVKKWLRSFEKVVYEDGEEFRLPSHINPTRAIEVAKSKEEEFVEDGLSAIFWSGLVKNPDYWKIRDLFALDARLPKIDFFGHIKYLESQVKLTLRQRYKKWRRNVWEKYRQRYRDTGKPQRVLMRAGKQTVTGLKWSATLFLVGTILYNGVLYVKSGFESEFSLPPLPDFGISEALAEFAYKYLGLESDNHQMTREYRESLAQKQWENEKRELEQRRNDVNRLRHRQPPAEHLGRDSNHYIVPKSQVEAGLPILTHRVLNPQVLDKHSGYWYNLDIENLPDDLQSSNASYETESDSVIEITPQTIDESNSPGLESYLLSYPTLNRLKLTVPEGYIPAQIYISDARTKKLFSWGTDYKAYVIPQNGLSYVEFKTQQTGPFYYKIYFTPTPYKNSLSPDDKIFSLDGDTVVEQLRGIRPIGARYLHDVIYRKFSHKKVSISDLAQSISEYTYYTYEENPHYRPWDALDNIQRYLYNSGDIRQPYGRIPQWAERWTDYMKYVLQDEGTFAWQCTGSNEFVADLVEYTYRTSNMNGKIDVQAVHGFRLKPGDAEVTTNNFHRTFLVTQTDQAFSYLHVDATPYKLVPGEAHPQAREPLATQPEDRVFADEPLAGQDPAEPFFDQPLFDTPEIVATAGEYLKNEAIQTKDGIIEGAKNAGASAAEIYKQLNEWERQLLEGRDKERRVKERDQSAMVSRRKLFDKDPPPKEEAEKKISNESVLDQELEEEALATPLSTEEEVLEDEKVSDANEGGFINRILKAFSPPPPPKKYIKIVKWVYPDATPIVEARQRVEENIVRLKKKYPHIVQAFSKHVGLRVYAYSRLILEMAKGKLSIEESIQRMIALSIHLPPFAEYSEAQKSTIEKRKQVIVEHYSEIETQLNYLVYEDLKNLNTAISNHQTKPVQYGVNVEFLSDAKLSESLKELSRVISLDRWVPQKVQLSVCEDELMNHTDYEVVD